MKTEKRLSADQTRIGVVGLGRMGTAVAQRLGADGAPLLLWNRTRARAAQAQVGDTQVADGLDEVFERCVLVLLMVFDYAAAQEVLLCQSHRLAGRTIALLTDLAPTESDRLRTLVETTAGSYVEAQIYATAEEVAMRQAWVLIASADADAAKAVADLLRPLGEVRRLGAPPAASVLKIALLNLYLSAVPALAASVALLERRGVASSTFVEITSNPAAFSPFVGDLARRMVAHDFRNPINDLRGLGKDLTVLVGELRAAALPEAAALTKPLRRVVAQAVANNDADRDMCALVELLQSAPVTH